MLMCGPETQIDMKRKREDTNYSPAICVQELGVELSTVWGGVYLLQGEFRVCFSDVVSPAKQRTLDRVIPRLHLIMS